MKRSLQLLLLVLIVGTACSQGEIVGPSEEIASAPDFARRPGLPPFGPLPAPPNGPPVWTGAPTELSIVKTTPFDNTVAPGDPFWFDVTVTNIGSATASRAFLTDLLPDFASSWTAEVVGEDGPICIDAGTQFLCGMFVSGPTGTDFVGVDLPPGASYTVRFTAANDQGDCGTVTNTASVLADNASEVSDSASVVVICPPQ